MQKLIPLACLLLVGCGSTEYVKQPLDMAAPASALTAPCDQPVQVTAESASQVETQWKQDRAALASCGNRHKQQTEWYAKRDAELVK